MSRASWLFLVILARLVIATQMIMTPNGRHDASKVHLVPPGAEIHRVSKNEVHIVDSNGTFIYAVDTSGENRTKTLSTRDLDEGWVAYASWSNETAVEPISFFNATWLVPSKPQKTNNQLLFLFNALQTSNLGGNIIQPVLQWGHSDAGGRHYWAVSNWYGQGSHFFHTKLYRVDPRVLYGEIVRIQLVNGYVYYRCRFVGLPEASEMMVRTDQDFYFAGVAFEAYSLSSIKNFPPAWTTFAHVNLMTTGGYPDMKWDTHASTIDKLRMVVNKQGSKDAEVTVVYQS
ncbi:hypothetical protein DL93DRAFT_2218942 [Clavulina sp. PMI_390]|nr:hypothetical protein DL93DRAFT_2218942 [Clavulina sp. PMI_390]